jgi:hypothetical protein
MILTWWTPYITFLSHLHRQIIKCKQNKEQSKEAPNLVDPLDRAILSHLAPQKQSLKICTSEQI